MFTNATGPFIIVLLMAWVAPIVFAIWLILSLNEIRNLLRSILSELRRTGP
jgi:hypothetical protein